MFVGAYARDGVQLALGRYWTGEIRHVATVEDGAACGCACPACGRKLIAKEGSRRRHFAHAKLDADGDVDFRCDGGQMTALHQFAQRLIVDQLMLTLPPVAAGNGEERIERTRARRMTFTAAAMEEVLGSLRPDVTLKTGENALYVEVYVTHACSPEKVATMRAAGQALLEIDLSKTDRDVDLSDLKDWILHRAPRRWLYNRYVDELELEVVRLREERERIAAAEEERRLASYAAKMKSDYSRAERAALADNQRGDPEVRRADGGGWRHLIGGFDALAAGFFTVHPERWRAQVLTSILRNHQRLSAGDITDFLLRKRMVNRSLANRSLDERIAAKRAGMATLDAVTVVEHYLQFLKQAGAADDDGGDWRRSPSMRQLMDSWEQREIEEVHEEERRRDRMERLEVLLNDLKRRLPAELGDDFEARATRWRNAPFEGTSPLRIACEGVTAWDELTKALSAIAVCMRDGADGAAPPTLGLPHVGDAMEDAVLLRQERIIARQERERLQAVERARELERQAEDRATSIRNAALNRLFEEADGWLSKVLMKSRMPPEDTARLSDSALRTVEEALDSAVRWRHLKLKALDDLEAFAPRHVPDVETRDLLLKTAHPKLPGSVSMRAYCRDETTLLRCKEIIMPPSRKAR